MRADPTRRRRAPVPHPSEFLKFVSCPRRAVEVASARRAGPSTATPRDGELRALELRDVNDEHGWLTINKARDNRTGELVSPEGGAGRRVPMEASLGRLVRALRGQCASHRDMARGLRR